MNSGIHTEQVKKTRKNLTSFVYQFFCDANQEFQGEQFGKLLGLLTKGGPDAVSGVKTLLTQRAVDSFSKSRNEGRNKVLTDVLKGALSSNPSLLNFLKV